MASNSTLRSSALAALQRWPKDILRPTAPNLGEVLTNRLKKQAQLGPHEQKQSAAIKALLDNRFSKHYAFDPEKSASGGMQKPRSSPEYYKTLMRELEEAPNRTLLQSVAARLKGLIRMDA